MATVTIDLEAIEHLIKSLRPKDKTHLFRRLAEDEIWKSQLDKVVTKMRKSVQERGISDKDIDQICEEVRKEHYEKNKRGL